MSASGSASLATLKRLAADLAHQIEEMERLPGGASETTLKLVHRAELARAIHADRRRRTAFFPEDLFGEPGWDILLDLLAAHEEGRPISVSSCCLAAAVPASTGLRWINSLTERGWIESVAHDRDLRQRLVRLTPLAVEKMRDWLSDMARRRGFVFADEAPPSGAPGLN